MKQKLESVINKGKILALASIAALTINCKPLLNQPVNYDAEPEVLGYVVTDQLFAPNCDISSILPCGIEWSGSDGYGEMSSGVGTWCPSGESCINGICR